MQDGRSTGGSQEAEQGEIWEGTRLAGKEETFQDGC